MIKGVAETTSQTDSAIMTSWFSTLPSYVIVLVIILLFIFLIALLGVIVYYIYRKFNSIDKHTEQNGTNNTTYKEQKRDFKDNINDLDAKVLPDSRTIISVVETASDIKKKIK